MLDRSYQSLSLETKIVLGYIKIESVEKSNGATKKAPLLFLFTFLLYLRNTHLPCHRTVEENTCMPPSDQNSLLSKTEKIVLQRVKKGLSNEGIAKDLSISINTIRTHKKSLFKKLGVKSVNEAIAVAENYYMI